MCHVSNIHSKGTYVHINIPVGPQAKWTVTGFKLNQNRNGPSKSTLVLPCRFWTNSVKLFWRLLHVYGRNQQGVFIFYLNCAFKWILKRPSEIRSFVNAFSYFVYFTDLDLSFQTLTHCKESTGLYQIMCICLPFAIFDLPQQSLNSGPIKKRLK
jgi:hypothetical protein